METKKNTYTFEQFLKDHCGMPKDATNWKPRLPIEGETPAQYGKNTWDEVYFDCVCWEGLDPSHPILRYWDNPFTEECDDAWKIAVRIVEDLFRLGAIDEDTMYNIFSCFHDNA